MLRVVELKWQLFKYSLLQLELHFFFNSGPQPLYVELEIELVKARDM